MGCIAYCVDGIVMWEVLLVMCDGFFVIVDFDNDKISDCGEVIVHCERCLSHHSSIGVISSMICDDFLFVEVVRVGQVIKICDYVQCVCIGR